MARCPGQGLHTGAIKWQSTPHAAQMRPQTERGCETVTYTHVIRWHSHSLLNAQEHMESRAGKLQVAGPSALQGEAGRGVACRLRPEANQAGPLPPHTHPRGLGISSTRKYSTSFPTPISTQGSHEGLKTQGGSRKGRQREGKKTKPSKEKYPRAPDLRAARILHKWSKVST